MLRILYGFILLCCCSQTVNAQPVGLPSLPDKDYVILATVINELSNCTDMTKAHLRGGQVFVKTRTETPSPYGFDLHNLAKEFAWGIEPENSRFHTDSSWGDFLRAVDASQFVSYTVDAQKVGPLACRKAVQWTEKMNDTYLGLAGAGFNGIRQDYYAFVGLVVFSNVVYSADGLKAICYYAKMTNERSGEGRVIFLERGGSFWQVVASRIMWVS